METQKAHTEIMSRLKNLSQDSLQQVKLFADTMAVVLRLEKRTLSKQIKGVFDRYCLRKIQKYQCPSSLSPGKW